MPVLEGRGGRSASGPPGGRCVAIPGSPITLGSSGKTALEGEPEATRGLVPSSVCPLTPPSPRMVTQCVAGASVLLTPSLLLWLPSNTKSYACGMRVNSGGTSSLPYPAPSSPPATSVRLFTGEAAHCVPCLGEASGGRGPPDLTAETPPADAQATPSCACCAASPALGRVGQGSPTRVGTWALRDRAGWSPCGPGAGSTESPVPGGRAGEGAGQRRPRAPGMCSHSALEHSSQITSFYRRGV